MTASPSLSVCARRGIRLALTAVLTVGMAWAEDDLDYQNPDGSVPDHGGFTYFGPRHGSPPLLTAADDLAAPQMRTWRTRRALASAPLQRGAALQAPNALGIVRHAANSVACSGMDDCIQAAADAAGALFTYLTTDTEFLRRVRLDLTGRIPTRQEVLEFLGDASSDKRARLVDRLLQTPEWADRWAVFFGDLFRNTVRTAQVNRYVNGRDSLHLYLLESMRQNKPYDQMAREMLAAEGFSDGRTCPDRYTSFQHFQSVYDNYQANPVQASAVGYTVGTRTAGGPIQDTYDTLAFFTARTFRDQATFRRSLAHSRRMPPPKAWRAPAIRRDGKSSTRAGSCSSRWTRTYAAPVPRLAPRHRAWRDCTRTRAD